MLEQQNNLNDLQEKISLGKRITKPSEDPNGAIRVLQIRQEIFRLDQYSQNGAIAESNLSFEESTLNSVVTQYHRIKELAISANNGSISSMERSSIANELEVILSELTSLANSKNGLGEYTFSGFKSNTAPVSQSLTGAYIYQGDEGQRKIQLNDSTFLDINDTAKDVFFSLPSSTINTVNHNEIATVTSSEPGLVNSGALASLDKNELIINNILIKPAEIDLLSTTDSQKSAIAIANAINAQKSEHGVDAIVQPNSLDMGIYTAQPLGAGALTINGIAIVDAVGTESSLMSEINLVSDQTGVVATQPGGAGTSIVLSAADGRNIQLETAGGETADFANFTLTGGAEDQVKRSTIVLRDHSAIEIQGSMPSDIGLTRGIQNVTTNSGTGQMTTEVKSNVSNSTESYSIIFNPGGTTFNIVLDSNPTQSIAGFDNVTFVPGQAIEFDGVRAVITGVPSGGDTFSVGFDQPASQDIFTTTQNLIDGIRLNSNTPEQLGYVIDVALLNIEQAELQLDNTRAKIGARLNVIDSLENNNANIKFIAQSTLSRIEDLDYAEAISNLSQLTLTLQAAQQSFTRIQGLSLFNFL